MYNAFASAQAAWRQPLLPAADRALGFAAVTHAPADPARKPWAVSGDPAALIAPAAHARVRAPRGTPLV